MVSDIQFVWCLGNLVEDEKERHEELDEYMKVLNMRLRPESCPELRQQDANAEKRMNDDEYEKAIGSGFNPALS